MQVKYGWSPKANLGPQLARMAERAQAEALRDSADLMDYQAAYGKEAWQHLSESMVLTVLLPVPQHSHCSVPNASVIGSPETADPCAMLLASA
jgi:hypothetical protein